MFEQAEEKKDKRFLREDLGERLLNKDVLGLTLVWLFLFWSGFTIGLFVGRL